MRETVLLADDDERFVGALARALTGRGLTVQCVASGAEAILAVKRCAFDFAAVDLRMPGGGMPTLQALRSVLPELRIVIVTGYGSIATATQAMRLGALHYMTKPVDADDLLVAFAQGFFPSSPAAQVPSLARVEWEHIQRVLADCQGNISQAARLLRIERRSLQRKLAKVPTE